MSTAVDLSAEREASIARQRARIPDISSRVLLHIAGWGSTPEELEEAALRQHPNRSAAERAAIVEAAMWIQQAEAPKRAHAPEPEAEMPTVEQVKNSAEFRAALRAFVQDNPTAGASEARKAVEEKVGRSVADSSFYREWKAATADAPKVEKPAPAPTPAPQASAENRNSPNENGNGAHPPVNRIAAADVAFSDAVHDGSPGPVLQQAVREEIRSLRATYEAGQFVRVEEEDGVWCLRVSMEFTDRRDAFAALIRMLDGSA